MMESIEKLREWAQNMARDIDKPSIGRFANAIEEEISEKYMLLPVDADGVPIRVGDTVIDYKTERIVVAITENAIVMDGYTDGDSIRIDYAVNHPHVKPRTVEDILREVVKSGTPTGEGGFYYEDAIFEKYADELRELLGGDA